jgi:hypothetical protein
MNKTQIWRTEEAQLLRQLREEAKTDSLVFARLNALSLAQLQELEGHGAGGFYNPQIKANTGIKLLKKLGHEWVPPEEPLSTELMLDTAMTANLGLVSKQTHRPALSPTPRKASALLLIGGLTWMTWQLWEGRLAFTPSTQTMLDARKPQTEPSHAEKLSPDQSGDIASSSLNLNTLQRMPVSQTMGGSWTQTPQSEVSACDDQLRQTSFAYEPVHPIKAGNYIHFLATQDVSLCVRDQQNQLTRFELKAGASRSVYGDPPFLVHSPKWSSLQVFFQGRPVSGIPDGSAHWLFKTRAL